jgi:hypothetical protein
MAQKSGQKKKKPRAKPRSGAYGARINQLFLDALRDLEELKKSTARPKPARGRA